MRFIRLAVRNYRGITAAEVKFGPTGITLVQGPNEAGKTSLSESIGILFEYLDSSRHRSIEAIKPVNRDEGPQIELEMESGPYVFTYFKRFLKKPETVLTVTKPKQENHTGREAHERAEAILRETLDIDLWKALAIQQGEAITQPDLSKQTSLSTALDKAAGGRIADPQEESLFNTVHDTYLLYYTESAKEKKELAEVRRKQSEAEIEVDRLNRAIKELDDDIERAEVLQQELEQLRKQEEELTKEIVGHTAVLDEIDALERTLTIARLKLESARKSEQSARQNVTVRTELMNALSKAAISHKGLKESVELSNSAVEQAETAFQSAQVSYDEANRNKEEAESLAALRHADCDYYNDVLQYSQLLERKKRIDEARETAARAKDTLHANNMDAKALDTIRKAERELFAATTRLQMGAPRASFHALSDCRVVIDGEEISLHTDENRELSIADKAKITISDLLDIEITAGANTGDLVNDVEKAQAKLDTACTKAGVRTPDEAQKAYDGHCEALRLRESAEREEKENLRDLTYDGLDSQVRDLKQTVSGYLAKRGSIPPICADLASAKDQLALSKTAKTETIRLWESAQSALKTAQGVKDHANATYQEDSINLGLSAKALAQANEQLERARSSASDDELEAALSIACQTVASEQERVTAAETSLEEKNPERTRLLAETATGSLRTTQGRLAAAKTEMTEVRTRLKIHGEEGLYEKLDAAQNTKEQCAASSSSLFRRAAAAKLLYETMKEERENVRRAYVAPLKEKIEQLGRLVFDDSFHVDINEELRIVSRTVQGVSVPFDSLSGGTREQLSLIFRAACSMIVSPYGGTPFVLDDALGYTDPKRLRSMGVVLAMAAKECQVVIFTCVPDRYDHIGDATVVPLRVAGL